LTERSQIEALKELTGYPQSIYDFKTEFNINEEHFKMMNNLIQEGNLLIAITPG
jgi:hypothetical protein